MSIRVIKQGMLDVFQDDGRYGYQHLGINPGGVMDAVALRIGNALVLNSWNEAVLEMHFPAPELLFEQDAFIALSGADFSASIDGYNIPLNHPVSVKKGAILSFLKPVAGIRTYLSVYGGFVLQEWLRSCSTNLQCGKGGYFGRQLKTNDVILFKRAFNHSKGHASRQFYVYPFSANTTGLYCNNNIRMVAGPHFMQLKLEDKNNFEKKPFTISNNSNRMGYRLKADALSLMNELNLISTGVTRGTIQLLPSGQLIVLMADHQTTGGYPIIGNVISADFSALAQTKPSQEIQFLLTDLSTAQKALIDQQQHLLQVQNACTFQLKELL